MGRLQRDGDAGVSDPEIVCVYGSEACLMAALWREVKATRPIRAARSLEELRAAFTDPAKLARSAGDTELLGWLTDAKDRRKKELETV